MSLEQALLDRLEKRSLQVAQKENEIYGLRELVDEKMAINEQLAEQITTARLEREKMQHQITELRTEFDRIREISKSLVPKAALKQAVQEAAELRSEVVKLRAEVPLESTREALKNAVAKLQEVTTDRDRLQNELAAIYAEANKSGYCNGDPVAQIKKGQQDHDAAESMERQLEAYSSLSNARAQKIRKLMDGHAEDLKAQAELLAKYEKILAQVADLGSYAMTLGRNEGEPLEMFMERLALRIAAIESQTRPLHDEIARLNAKVGPLEKLYEVVKKHVDNCAIIDNRADIYDAVAETAKALSQLTA